MRRMRAVPSGMKQIMLAAKREYLKLGRTFFCNRIMRPITH
ncbi:hypothetical protein ACFTAO_27780 [Paenibacillus rhizoplanae]